MASTSYSSIASTSKSMIYYMIDYWNVEGDWRTRDYPLMTNGPWSMLSILACYLLFVNKIGPQLMKERAPFQLRSVMIAYNILLVTLNSYFFIESLICLRFGLSLLNFDFPDRSDTSELSMRMINSAYLYFLTKFVDLFDTVFFVMRKKYNQVTVLHLYHHTVVPVLGWIAFRIAPTAVPIGLFPIVNSLIHIVMYTYYALSALGPGVQKYLWWKKYITLLQLYQFVLYGLYFCLFLCFQRGYPRVYVTLGFIQPPLFFYLFYTFYQASYSKEQNKIMKSKSS